MVTIHRAFLSHSSNEKALVNAVARHFTAARVVVDSLSFEDGKRSADEIVTYLKDTSVFVVFLSETAVESNWVNFELREAIHKLAAETLIVVPYIVDDLPLDKVPKWLQAYTVRRSNSALRIAEMIEQELEALDEKKGQARRFFVGRNEELAALIRALSPIASPSPTVLFLGGVDGIGKKTLLQRAIFDALHQVLKTNRIIISLSDESGLVELFERLLDYRASTSFIQMKAELDAFRGSESLEQVKKVASLIRSLNDEKLLITVIGRLCLVGESGDLQPWIASVLQELQSNRFPRLALLCPRMVRAEFRSSYPNVVFQSVRNLQEGDSRDLLALWLNSLEVPVTEQEVRSVISITGGRPSAIIRAAELAEEHGITIVLERQALRRILSLGYESTIRQIRDEPDQIVIATLLHFERLSLEDIAIATARPRTVIADSLAHLLSNMILENEADTYFIAPHLIDVISRLTWMSRYDAACRDASRKLLTRIETFAPDDYVSVVALNAAVVGAIYDEMTLESDLTRLVKPAQLLRVGRKLYDAGKYTRASVVLGRALENSQGLTEDAIIEGLRLRAMCLARLSHEHTSGRDEFFNVVGQLENFKSVRARRSVCFVKGFRARLSGDLNKAHEHYKAAIRDFDGDQNFHILNEYAKIQLRLGEYADAIRYARLALNWAPTNPYPLDVLVCALVEKSRKPAEQHHAEIERLLEDLEKASASMGTCHFQCCKSRYLLKLNQQPEALELATEAVDFVTRPLSNADSDMVFQAYYTRASCYFAARHYKQMEGDLAELEKRIREVREFRRFGKSVLELRVKQLVGLRSFDIAHATVRRAIGVSQVDRAKIQTDLEREEAYATSH